LKGIEAVKEKGIFHQNYKYNQKKEKGATVFKVEFEPKTRALKKNEVYPIYKMQFLLHRRNTFDKPHKRNGPLQTDRNINTLKTTVDIGQSA